MRALPVSGAAAAGSRIAEAPAVAAGFVPFVAAAGVVAPAALGLRQAERQQRRGRGT